MLGVPHSPLSLADDDLAKFAKGMPAAYRRLFDEAEMRAHWAIIAGRGQRSAHVGIWAARPREAAICVVASSRPGLLSLMGDALSSQELDPQAAQIYEWDGESERRETVALFWVRREAHSLLAQDPDADDIRNFTYVLAQLIEEQQRADDIGSETRLRIDLPSQPARVYYDTRALRGGESVLIVDAPDCPGLLLAVTRALFRQRAEIVASEVRTEDGVAKDRFTICGAAGTTLTPDRLADVQQGVLSAVRHLVAQHHRLT
jgi:UTP:GlnB (protein PII) uridylyltransferase